MALLALGLVPPLDVGVSHVQWRRAAREPSGGAHGRIRLGEFVVWPEDFIGSTHGWIR